MSNVDDFLKLAESGNKNDRKSAAKSMGKLDYQFAVVMEKLEELQKDSDKGVKKEANNALKNLRKKPVSEPSATTEDGTSGTAFDDEVGDSSLEPGEYDVETSMGKREEDRAERAAEGKGLNVVLLEKNFAKLDYYGNVLEREPSQGSVTVINTGAKSRITGVDLKLKNVYSVKSDEGLEEHMHIGLVAPGDEAGFKRDYTYDKEFTPIKVEQTYADPETGVSPNFTGGEEREFEMSIKITNTSDVSIFNVKGTKTLNEIAKVGDITFDGEQSESGGKLEFSLEELAAGESKELVAKLTASLAEDMASYESGELNVVYSVKDALTSGLEFESVDGVSDIKQKVRRKQNETDPTFYDCEITFENRSEFVYDMNRFTVFADNMESQAIVLDWDGTQSTEDEREIVPGEKVAFEFTYESEETPQFGNFIDFSIQSEVSLLTENSLTLPAQPLRFMAIEITKSFLDGEEEVMEYKLPSYRETEIPTLVRVTGVGTFGVEAVVVSDQIPEGFSPPEESAVTVKRNGEPLGSDRYNISVTDDAETAGKRLVVSIEHLEETEEGGFQKDETIDILFSSIAVKPEPREEAINTQSFVEGYLYEAPDAKVRAESELEGLKLVVIHERSLVDISKSTIGIDYQGQNAFEIEIEAENVGTATETITIEDLVPTGFAFIEDTLAMNPEGQETVTKSAEGGQVYGWTFANIEPETMASVTFTVVEEDTSADTRKLFTVYKG